MTKPDSSIPSRRRRPTPATAVTWTLLLYAVVVSTRVDAQVALTNAFDGQLFAEPMHLTHAGDSTLYVVERGGRIWEVDPSQEPVLFLDIDDRVRSVGGEQGLFSAAFHPRFSSNGFVYVNYTDNSGDTVISRFQAGSSRPVDPSTENILLEIEQPFENHNGGQVQFGPDGFLYVGMGDGGSGNDPDCYGQRTDTLLGKMLRLDVDQNSSSAPFHGIPAGNPFAGVGPFLDEVWAVGLRNPWRFSFDPQSGDLFIGDVGQSAREEVNVQSSASSGGENYGWKVMEGSLCSNLSTNSCDVEPPVCNDPAYSLPALEYNTNDNCAVVGGTVYRGSDVPALAGRYIYGDFCSGRIFLARRTSGTWRPDDELDLQPGNITSFGQDTDGEVYVVTDGGAIFRFVEAAETAGQISFAETEIFVDESAGSATLIVERTGGASGAVSVRYRTVERTALADIDYTPVDGQLDWEDGNSSSREIVVPLVDDAIAEEQEFFRVRIESPGGGATLGTTAMLVFINDDDEGELPCVAGESTLCLNDGRFRVTSTYRTPSGDAGVGRAAPLTDDSGTFWFFDESNVEVLVKLLDACDPFDAFWVFAAGLTDVETTLTVTDTRTGASRVYQNPQSTPFRPVTDTAAFDTCP